MAGLPTPTRALPVNAPDGRPYEQAYGKPLRWNCRLGGNLVHYMRACRCLHCRFEGCTAHPAVVVFEQGHRHSNSMGEFCEEHGKRVLDTLNRPLYVMEPLRR